MDLKNALYDRMAGDATLTALLSTYHGTPAIFMGPTVPDDFEEDSVTGFGHVHSYANVSDEEDGTKTDAGNDIFRDVFCYTENDGDPDPVTAIAERVRALFNRHQLAISGAATIVASASGPVPAETDNEVLGLVVHLRFRVEPA